MNKKIRNFVVIPTILPFFTACTERIEIPTNDAPSVVVIYGVLTSSLKQQEMKINLSAPYFDNSPNRNISDATVIVRSSDNKTYPFIENNAIPGMYYSKKPFGAKNGLIYSLSVETENNGGAYEASTAILPCPPIDSLTLEPIEIFGHKNYIAYVHFSDPPEENFYLFKVFYNDSLITDKISDYIITSDIFFNGQVVKNHVYMFDDDEISEWETGPEENRRNPFYLKPGDNLSVEMSAISQGYFDFLRQCRKEKNGKNPMFDTPASNIVTNISNGGAGYFSGYGISRETIVFREQ
jgi:hypothetical protein